MRKAILYLLFLGLFFSNSSLHAMTSCEVKAKVATHKNAVSRGLSKKGSSSRKVDLLTDFDDYDEYDDHDTTPAKDKLCTTNALSFKGNPITDNYGCKGFCTKIYYYVNSSRLPRYNYISLRVLRI